MLVHLENTIRTGYRRKYKPEAYNKQALLHQLSCKLQLGATLGLVRVLYKRQLSVKGNLDFIRAPGIARARALSAIPALTFYQENISQGPS